MEQAITIYNRIMTNHKNILIVTGDAGESFEILYAKHRFSEAGYRSTLAAPAKKRLNLVIHDFEPGWDTYVERKGYLVESEKSLEEVDPAEYDAVLFPGGRAPEYLRNSPRVMELVRHFHESGKYIFAICHGVQILLTAGLVDGKQVACYEHVRFEVESCGGIYVDDREAVIDDKMVTGKTWQSHPEFYKSVFQCLAKSELVSE